MCSISVSVLKRDVKTPWKHFNLASSRNTSSHIWSHVQPSFTSQSHQLQHREMQEIASEDNLPTGTQYFDFCSEGWHRIQVGQKPPERVIYVSLPAEIRPKISGGTYNRFLLLDASFTTSEKARNYRSLKTIWPLFQVGQKSPCKYQILNCNRNTLHTSGGTCNYLLLLTLSITRSTKGKKRSVKTICPYAVFRCLFCSKRYLKSPCKHFHLTSSRNTSSNIWSHVQSFFFLSVASITT